VVYLRGRWSPLSSPPPSGAIYPHHPSSAPAQAGPSAPATFKYSHLTLTVPATGSAAKKIFRLQNKFLSRNSAVISKILRGRRGRLRRGDTKRSAAHVHGQVFPPLRQVQQQYVTSRPGEYHGPSQGALAFYWTRVGLPNDLEQRRVFDEMQP